MCDDRYGIEYGVRVKTQRAEVVRKFRDSLLMKSFRFLVLMCALSVTAVNDSAAARDRDYWVLVDTQKMVLSVLEANKVRKTFDRISIGRAGAALNKKSGDNRTPLGEFRLVRITSDSSFHRFFGIDYPTVAHARRAYRAGVIDSEDYAAIFNASRTGAVPPQTTPLGGNIGIHGIGSGDPKVHDEFNWTQGCIALTNRQIDDLSRWVYLGMRVVIR